MKKTLFIFSIVLLSMSCTNDDAVPESEQDSLLTRVSWNGITSLELQYDIDRKLIRLDAYYLGKLATYHIYEYNGETLRESRRYNAENHSLEYRSVFTADNFGRIVKIENYNQSDLNELANVNHLEYTSSGQLKTRKLIFAATGNSWIDEFNYDDQNNLTSTNRTTYDGTDVFTSFEITYTPGQQSIPPNWANYVFILWLSNIQEKVMHMFNDITRFKFYSPNGALISDHEYQTSGHLFNDGGDLIQVTVTDKNILSPQTADEVFDLNYDFQ